MTIMALLTVGAAMAQPNEGPRKPLTAEQREKVEAMKAAFLTTKLDMTPEESTQFWPVYNQYQKELNDLRENRFKDFKELRDSDQPLTDKDYEKRFDGELTFRQAELDIMKKYHPQLKKTLSMKKLAKLPRAEEEFKRELLNKMRDRQEGQRQEGQRPGAPRPMKNR